MAATHRQALISRPLDFWLLGGGSLLALAALLVARSYAGHVFINSLDWVLIASYSRIVIEYPHLLASYKIAYSRGPEFLRQNFFATIGAPILLLMVALSGLLLKNWADPLFLIGVHAIFLGFGWHRLRQVWGLMVIYARYDGIKLDSLQKRTTHWFLMSLWIFGYLTYISTARELNFFNFKIALFHIPQPFLLAAAFTFASSGIAFIFLMVLRPLFVHRQRLSVNFLVPLVAILFWWAALSLEPIFFFYLAPAFHSLQYLAVVWAYERGPKSAAPSRALRSVLVFGGLLTLGFLLEHGPNIILPHGSKVIAVAYVLLSIHHYLLDGVIWRTTDPNLKNLLE